MIRPDDGPGREEREIVEVGGRRDRDEALDLRPAHQQLHADPGAEREAGDPAAARFRVDGLRPVERGGGVGEFALAVVERALAAADAAEIEPQHREIAVRERIVELIDDLVVHRAAELRMRVQHDGERCVLLPCGMIPALDTSGGAGKDHFRHRQPRSRRFVLVPRRSRPARLTAAAWERKHLEPFKFLAQRMHIAACAMAGMDRGKAS